MIDKKDFDAIRKELAGFDEQRELIIKDSRKVLKLSKQVIYSVHRNEMPEAEKLVREMKKELASLKTLTENHPELYYSPSYKIAAQEYAEAVMYFEFVKNKKIPVEKEVGVDAEQYLMGLFDLIGELVRKAINSAIKNDFKTSVEIRDVVSEMYGEFLKFDLRNGQLRKKFDGVKYELKKLDDLVFDLKMKGKIK